MILIKSDNCENEYSQRLHKVGPPAQMRVRKGCETSNCHYMYVLQHIGSKRAPGWK